MELTSYYLEQIVKVHGVYVLQVSLDDVTDELINNIHESWELSGIRQPLYILPKQFEISFLEKYPLYIALMIVRGGQYVTREKWIQETMITYASWHNNPAMLRMRVKHKAPYLKLNDDGVIVKYDPETKEEVVFNMDIEALDAEDYVITERRS